MSRAYWVKLASSVSTTVKADDKATIEAASTKLTEVTGTVAQKIFNAQSAQGEAAAGGSGAGAEKDASRGDDVVDAEFEEVKDDKK